LRSDLAADPRSWLAESIYAALVLENQARCRPPLRDSQIDTIAESISSYPPSEINLNRLAAIKQVPELIDVRADQIQARLIQWLWRNWIPLGKLVVVDGDPGLGKSTMLVDLAARLSRGRPMPDQSPAPQISVLMATSEDGLEDTVVPRLMAAEADLSRITCIKEIRTGTGRRPLTLPADIPILQQRIRDRNVKLFIIDPLMSFLGTAVDSCKDQDVRGCLHQLGNLAEEEGCTILFLRHLNKATGGKAIYRGGGSIGIIAAARVGMIVAQDPNDDRGSILACSKNNVAEKPRSLKFQLDPTHHQVCRVAWTGTSDCEADDLLNAANTPEEKTANNEAVEFLRNYLSEGPQPGKSILRDAKAQGIPEFAIRKAGTILKVQTYRDGFGKQQIGYWHLPETGPSQTNPQPSEQDEEQAA
jgi:hypothetical protein